jgi:hypothetical protein
MSVARDSLERPGDEAAMARVLAAERKGREALEQSRREAAHILHDARAAAKAVSARAARRAANVRAAMEARLATRLAEIDAQEREALLAGDLDTATRASLARAIELLAAELTCREPPP